MKRIIYLAMAALLAMMILVPTVALAQDLLPGDDDPYLPEQNVVEFASKAEITQMLPKSGGPRLFGTSLLLPTAALLLGSGILVYAVVRRRG